MCVFSFLLLKGFSALHFAARRPNSKIVQLLLKEVSDSVHTQWCAVCDLDLTNAVKHIVECEFELQITYAVESGKLYCHILYMLVCA